MDKGGTLVAAGTAAGTAGAGLALTGVGAAPGAAVAAAGGATAAVGTGVAAIGGVSETLATGLDAMADHVLSGKLPNLSAMAAAYAQRVVMGKLDKLTQVVPGKKAAGPGQGGKPHPPGKGGGTGGAGGADGFKVLGAGNGPCIVGRYDDIKSKCPEGQQAHHIIPDKYVRTGNRASGMAGLGRIPGMPSFGGGPAICLTGSAGIAGSEHNEAHLSDAEIEAIGRELFNGPVGTAPVKDVVPVLMKAAAAAKPECKTQIEQQVRSSFPNYESDSRSMRTTDQPAKEDARAHLESGNTADKGTTFKKPTRRK